MNLTAYLIATKPLRLSIDEEFLQFSRRKAVLQLEMKSVNADTFSRDFSIVTQKVSFRFPWIRF